MPLPPKLSFQEWYLKRQTETFSETNRETYGIHLAVRACPLQPLYKWISPSFADSFLDGRMLLRDLSYFRNDPGGRGDPEEGQKSLAGVGGALGSDSFVAGKYLILSFTESSTPLKCAPSCERLTVDDAHYLAHLLAYWANTMFDGVACFFGPVSYGDERIASESHWQDWDKLVALKHSRYSEEREWRFAAHHMMPTCAVETAIGDDLNFWRAGISRSEPRVVS